ncbi:MAG: hypothetical protein JW810_03445 [Sedimentisphaerales bacterium]|nr:hypothetical protein [Sedimentisphaerales bacterium]
MNALTDLLAQAASLAAEQTEAQEEVPSSFLSRVPIDDIWQFIADISWLEAVVFVAFGVIYLAYGWRVFKALVVINFAVLGMYLGIYLGGKLGSGLWGGIIGVCALGTLSYPFMRFGIAILGGMAGAVLGASFWRIIALPDPLIWAGALAGLVAGGLLAFSSYKTSIMLFTSLQGSMFVVIGMLALLNDYPNLGERLSVALNGHVFLLPALLVIPTFTGIFFQARLLKQESDWAMPE